MSPTAKEMGQTLRRLMKQKKMNQTKLAERAGLSREYVNRIVAGRYDPPLSTINALAKALRVRPARLLGMKEGGAMDQADVHEVIGALELMARQDSRFHVDANQGDRQIALWMAVGDWLEAPGGVTWGGLLSQAREYMATYREAK